MAVHFSEHRLYVVQGEHVVDVIWLTRAKDLVNQDNSAESIVFRDLTKLSSPSRICSAHLRS